MRIAPFLFEQPLYMLGDKADKISLCCVAGNTNRTQCSVRANENLLQLLDCENRNLNKLCNTETFTKLISMLTLNFFFIVNFTKFSTDSLLQSYDKYDEYDQIDKMYSSVYLALPSILWNSSHNWSYTSSVIQLIALFTGDGSIFTRFGSGAVTHLTDTALFTIPSSPYTCK